MLHLASQRAVDAKLSTYTRYNGERLMIRPWHPFTKASQQPVTPGEATEYKIEIYPTSAIVKAGDRLRLTIGTANTFSSAPPLMTMIFPYCSLMIAAGAVMPEE